MAELVRSLRLATGYTLAHTGKGSVKLANGMLNGTIRPDIFVSADAEVNRLLMGAVNGDRVR